MDVRGVKDSLSIFNFKIDVTYRYEYACDDSTWNDHTMFSHKLDTPSAPLDFPFPLKLLFACSNKAVTEKFQKTLSIYGNICLFMILISNAPVLCIIVCLDMYIRLPW